MIPLNLVEKSNLGNTQSKQSEPIDTNVLSTSKQYQTSNEELKNHSSHEKQLNSFPSKYRKFIEP